VDQFLLQLGNRLLLEQKKHESDGEAEEQPESESAPEAQR
jgi:hypothetical protein